METVFNSLQLREVFHLEFLRWFGRKVKPVFYALKGGVNLRFFFNSFRYSEDMDLDISGINVAALKETVMKILKAPAFNEALRPFGIREIKPPDTARAKQTETTQKFKVHLLTLAGEDLFSKIEFSRRGLCEGVVVQPVSSFILREYRLPPLVAPHYDIASALAQKIDVLAGRSVIQARDVFDLFVLKSQYAASVKKEIKISGDKLNKAHKNLFEVTFERFRDTVLSYLSEEDQAVYNSPDLWDDVKLKVAAFIEELKG